MIEVQPKEDYKIVLDEENDFEEKGKDISMLFPARKIIIFQI